jgi:hypothetical protein
VLELFLLRFFTATFFLVFSVIPVVAVCSQFLPVLAVVVEPTRPMEAAFFFA